MHLPLVEPRRHLPVTMPPSAEDLEVDPKTHTNKPACVNACPVERMFCDACSPAPAPLLAWFLHASAKAFWTLLQRVPLPRSNLISAACKHFARQPLKASPQSTAEASSCRTASSAGAHAAPASTSAVCTTSTSATACAQTCVAMHCNRQSTRSQPVQLPRHWPHKCSRHCVHGCKAPCASHRGHVTTRAGGRGCVMWTCTVPFVLHWVQDTGCAAAGTGAPARLTPAKAGGAGEASAALQAWSGCPLLACMLGVWARISSTRAMSAHGPKTAERFKQLPSDPASELESESSASSALRPPTPMCAASSAEDEATRRGTSVSSPRCCARWCQAV